MSVTAIHADEDEDDGDDPVVLGILKFPLFLFVLGVIEMSGYIAGYVLMDYGMPQWIYVAFALFAAPVWAAKAVMK